MVKAHLRDQFPQRKRCLVSHRGSVKSGRLLKFANYLICVPRFSKNGFFVKHRSYSYRRDAIQEAEFTEITVVAIFSRYKFLQSNQR